MMRFKKTIIILLTVCLVASLAVITVNAARSNTVNTHTYSSPRIIDNTTGIVGGSTSIGYSAGTGNTTGIVGGSIGNVYSTGAGNNTTSVHKEMVK
jgi:hypothetical protein